MLGTRRHGRATRLRRRAAPGRRQEADTLAGGDEAAVGIGVPSPVICRPRLSQQRVPVDIAATGADIARGSAGDCCILCGLVGINLPLDHGCKPNIDVEAYRAQLLVEKRQGWWDR